ncbi:MAG: long-chain fatty acid--CoA ligase [Solirubrobacteraceae bacterium]
MLGGLMQDDFQLTLHHPLHRMRSVHPHAEAITLTDTGIVRASYGEIAARVDRLARVLEQLGVKPGDRVGTFAWNNQRHFELYMAVPCVGAVLHTLNIRLFAEQLTYIVGHAKDEVIFVDESLVPLLSQLAETFEGVRNYVVMSDPSNPGDCDLSALPGALDYEQLLDGVEDGPFDYPHVDERQAAALCYTSGTTGNPKGVLYSHRSISLHSTASLMTDALGLSRTDKSLVVVPMFHVNAWGIPHASALAGADLLLPDRFLQAEPLAKLIEAERPSIMACVPTIYADLLRYADEHGSDLSSIKNAACGGSAVPRELMRAYEERHGVNVYQAWGMTETSPVATYSRPNETGVHDDAYWDTRAKQGKPIPWVEARLIDDSGEEIAWDGQSTGELEVRGPWILAHYYSDETGEDRFDDGWLRTGDIAAIDEQAFVQITDRSKDVIKSGGEWISSVELENEVMAHPDVIEAAVIAKPDEKWAERPLCCVVTREGCSLSAEDLVEHLRPRVARWWLPDEFAFVSEVPKTSVGKFDKKVLRAHLREGTLEGRVRIGA